MNMKIVIRLPRWLQGCLVGNVIGSLVFVAFLALYSLTPLYLLFAVFAASGTSGVRIFGALAFPAALIGAWVGGLFGMLVGALAGRTSSNPLRPWAIPSWLTGAIVTIYLFLPNFLNPTARFASEPAVKRVLVFVILTALGALVGYVCGSIRRFFQKRR